MVGNAISWFEIYVQDMPRAKAFKDDVSSANTATSCLPRIPRAT